MSGSVIERLGYSVAAGKIHYDERPLDWSSADARAGFRLDRRKAWAFVDGEVCSSVTISRACSGCYEGYDGDTARGLGCEECGYNGRVRWSAWVPEGGA